MKYTVKNKYGEFTAVLYSPGVGRGYSTWGYGDPMDKAGEILAKMKKDGKFDLREATGTSKIDISNYMPDFKGRLFIAFIPVGTVFKITEYDGAENIKYYNPNDFYTA